MADFLLELRSEEIPARMQDKARADLERLFAAELNKDGLESGALTTYATPRRLALIARDLPLETQAVSEEIKGPRTSAPPQALEGFLRKTGLSQDQLTDRDGVWFAVIEKPGRATADVLAAAIPGIVRAFPWPKSMRWGDASLSTESLRWVRPLQGIVAILGEELVPCEIAGIGSGYATVGHRFHSPHAITIGGAHDYVEKLRACHVIVDQDERRAIIRDRAAALAADAGLALIEDEGLVAENAGLTEWPVPLMGRFDAAFLDVPPEVIQLTARVNQKYFVCQGADGTLADAFVCVANIAAKDGGARIVEGNRKVLAARLSDARFFYETDLKVALEEQAKKLEKIVFHEKLGTVADKVDRVAKLARWLVEEGIVGAGTPLSVRVERSRDTLPSEAEAPADDLGSARSRASTSLGTNGEGADRAALADLAERAARLAKADLVTGMVGEFPELQGLMGGYYARAQGEPREVWEAVRDHYKPVGQGDEVPTAPVTVAVSLADKLDTITGFFAINEKPTGSKDPFALRRAILGLAAIVLQNDLKASLRKLVLSGYEDHAYGLRSHELTTNRAHDQEKVADEIVSFAIDRLKVQQREAGVRHDLIDAVFALGNEDDLVRLLARVHALQAFVTTHEGANLLAGYKRASNILKKEGWETSTAPTSVTPAQAGVHSGERHDGDAGAAAMDSRLRGNDDLGGVPADTTAALAAAAARSAPFGTETGRPPEERRVLAADHDAGDAAIPQTGEEDPLVEVDTDRARFAPVVAEFAASQPKKTLSYTPEPAEDALITALDSAEPQAAAAIGREDFEGAMAALASLRAPIDAFFETVTVNDPDPARRAARLALLARMRDAVHAVADFSKIEG
ncbi:glycine--tRNA ligase subunit beta [Sphingomonas japonica]|uniref:Glycine--tRNA ligase beta subunit n=1 Tax=Sphingomonas japonica TaxID=511662 RepID=A0ABX0TY16_9SPHN|nr:glycine--tRNA ligase subunit beta [Sphingomonas japonica]NIJ22750.1 glycyl-tRNA synthetase beta chain [Sphingomonas japonica]